MKKILLCTRRLPIMCLGTRLQPLKHSRSLKSSSNIRLKKVTCNAEKEGVRDSDSYLRNITAGLKVWNHSVKATANKQSNCQQQQKSRNKFKKRRSKVQKPIIIIHHHHRHHVRTACKWHSSAARPCSSRLYSLRRSGSRRIKSSRKSRRRLPFWKFSCKRCRITSRTF